MVVSAPNVKAVFHGHIHNIVSSYIAHSAPQPNAIPYFFLLMCGQQLGKYNRHGIIEIYEKGSARTFQFDPESEVVLNTELVAMKATCQTCRPTFENEAFDV